MRFTRAPLPQPLQDLDGSGFAGAVRTQQSENFARAHLEIDAAHRFESSVALSKTADRDDGAVAVQTVLSLTAAPGLRCTHSRIAR